MCKLKWPSYLNGNESEMTVRIDIIVDSNLMEFATIRDQ